MSHVFNPDFQDFIGALNRCEVKYILVGGYAVILHGYSRTTGDRDIWVQAEGLRVCSLSIRDLLQSKHASGRNKDLDDIENLTKRQ